jgi:hypothetical protein
VSCGGKLAFFFFEKIKPTQITYKTQRAHNEPAGPSAIKGRLMELSNRGKINVKQRVAEVEGRWLQLYELKSIIEVEVSCWF